MKVSVLTAPDKIAIEEITDLTPGDNTVLIIPNCYSLENYADSLTAFKSGKGHKTIVLPNG